jgi:hypothetical protein
LGEEAREPRDAGVANPDAIDDGAGVVGLWVLLAEQMLGSLPAERAGARGKQVRRGSATMAGFSSPPVWRYAGSSVTR